MATFVVTTISTFKHKYFVEAANKDEAVEAVLGIGDAGGYQIHLGEAAFEVESTDATQEEFHRYVTGKGYF